MLSKNDYENVLNAIFQLSNINTHQSIEAFKVNVLTILRDTLQYEHAIFWDIVDGELIETPTTLTIKKQTITQYLTTYKYFDPLQPANIPSDTPIQLIQQQTISPQAKYYYEQQFLKPIAYKDEMVMYLTNGEQKIAAIGLLRQENEADFHVGDLKKLFYVRKIIENMYHATMQTQSPLTGVITKREEEVLTYLCKGYTNVEIAQLMFVSENTVKKHLQNLYRKLHVDNRTQLALMYAKYILH